MKLQRLMHSRPNILRSTVVGCMLVCSLPSGAAPSTELAREFCTELEYVPGGFAIVTKASGQVRVGRVDALNQVFFKPSYRSHQPDVRSVTSGFHNGSTEQLALASPTANRVIFAPVDGTSTVPYFPRQPGPNGVSLYREGNGSPDRLLLHCLYGPASSSPPFPDDYLEATEGSNMGNPVLINEAAKNFDLDAMQPLYLDSIARREAVAGWYFPDGPRLLLLYDDNGKIGPTLGDPLPPETRFASNARRADGGLMVVGYVIGSKDVTLINIDTSSTPWQPVSPYRVDTLPFGVGSISAATGADAPNGLLITSDDGTGSAYGQIDESGGKIDIVQDFTSTPDKIIHGFLPVTGHGAILLEGDERGSSSFRFHVWDGSRFTLKDSGSLPPTLPAQTTFATLLWYDNEPLVDLDAKLLQLDVEPDWTNGAGPVPADLTRENYVDQGTGLANPLAITPSVPGQATHVLTNQLLDTCSLAVLQPNSALFTPPLRVEPASDNYNDAVLAEALANTDYEILYREDRPGAPWQTYTFAFGVGYSSSWQFYARHLGTGESGPIISRTYTFPAEGLLGMDSDKDAVPDFVEQWLGLDPNGGPDTDNDLQSDLEEILSSTNPGDSQDVTQTENRNPPFAGEGFLLIAQAFDATTGEASPGEQIQVRSMSSSILDNGKVENLTTPPALVGQLGAHLTVNTPIPHRHWAVLSSPVYFNLGTMASPPRNGREVFRLLQVPDLALPTVNPALSGTDLASDAQAWIDAAQVAYGTYHPADDISGIHPLDTAIAVIGEAALYDALLRLDPEIQDSLDVPQTIINPPHPYIPGYRQFTLFGERDGDAGRHPLTEPMIAALEADGLSFANLLTLIEVAANAATPEAEALRDVTTALYNHHVANSSTTPLMPLPLEVLRLLARQQPRPVEYDPMPGITEGDIIQAQTAITGILDQLPAAYRPITSITVEVGPPSLPDQAFGYTNISSGNPVVFLDSFGEIFTLDQGLGLAHGTRISALGYNDLTPPEGHEAIEPLGLTVLSVPMASNSDSNGNLLDDDWEEFFFGALGVVNPFDPHPVNGFSYLQLFLLGHDPRCEDPPPDESMVLLELSDPEVIILPNSNFGLRFEFPDIFFNNFAWSLSQSPDLQVFSEIPGAVFQSEGDNHYLVDVGAIYSGFERRFFRIEMALP